MVSIKDAKLCIVRKVKGTDFEVVATNDENFCIVRKVNGTDSEVVTINDESFCIDYFLEFYILTNKLF